MASSLKNLSDFSSTEIPSASGYLFGLVVAEWNTEITESLYRGAYETLVNYGASEGNILCIKVPGSFELTHGAQLLAETNRFNAIICLGCIIQGETRHFDFICEAVANGLTTVSVNYNIPVVFGVLTTSNQQQAKERAGGKHGNKGDEAAVTAIKMANLSKTIGKG